MPQRPWDDAGYQRESRLCEVRQELSLLRSQSFFAPFVLAKLASQPTLSHLLRRLLVTPRSLRRALQ